ncbi:unnamed protein product [Fraxinus pennsylvanica]|uniref:SHSP domain-containing protein n=1 Tax=Fraxinus pennsylvanica TaxID=56036 RepID=A0AAD1ZG20_9LAMI|nr:unnamed protein product [Fraxinus pennsylvanica]
MEAKTLIEEFDPLCKWQRKEDRDILEIHLQEFKKEQLKAQISNSRILKISGEHPLDALRKSRFYKEVPIPRNIDENAISAKFVNGCLYIAMPKKLLISEKNEAAESTHEDQTKKQIQNGIDSSKLETFEDAKSAEDTPEVSEFRLQTLGEVVVTLATLAALIAYVVYMQRSMVPEIVEYF